MVRQRACCGASENLDRLAATSALQILGVSTGYFRVEIERITIVRNPLTAACATGTFGPASELAWWIFQSEG